MEEEKSLKNKKDPDPDKSTVNWPLIFTNLAVAGVFII